MRPRAARLPPTRSFPALGRPELAEDAYKKLLELYQRLVKAQPQDPQYQRALGVAWNNLGLLYYQTDRFTLCEKAWKEALQTRRALADTHPRVTEFQSDLTISYDNLASVYTELGRPDLSEQALRKAREIGEAQIELAAYELGLCLNADRLAGKAGEELLRTNTRFRGEAGRPWVQ